MFIGHTPAGYIITTLILNRLPNSDKNIALLWIGIIASVAPDLDMFYFYLFDHQQHLHHSYWTHLPIYWVGITSILVIIAIIIKNRFFLVATIIGSINIFGHMVLDTIVGNIRWLYPFSITDIVMFKVPARYDWWVWNFFLHWTFIFELAVITMALIIFLNKRKIDSRAH